MKQAYIFDMDGTLFQTDRILGHALEDVFAFLREQGRWTTETPLAEYRAIMGVPLPEVWRTLLPAHTEADRAQADQIFQDALIRHIEQGHGALYPGAEEVLAALQASGHAVYIASNGWKGYLAAIVRQYALERWLDGVYSIEDVASSQKSDLVAHILAHHRLKETVVVGDRISDFQAAKVNGLPAIGCRFYFSNEAELAQADAVIDDLQELLQLDVNAVTR
ncbi:HAD family hydrolase [Exiguobacterium sp. K1]|uniref:HAD family hydrolase n=1 Tax=Exiguobacterium sp. K1 TaxID=2980105 RepID=UPI00299E6556|nr:HAD hydrolase-like protein [Exiguobacterium sp. K1]MDX1258817.1 HAD hydrolase-like protein [Exiguobacterium sp. K1]